MDETSGCIDGFPKLGLGTDHFKTNKFKGPSDGNYVYVRNEIQRLVEKAPGRVETRLNRKLALALVSEFEIVIADSRFSVARPITRDGSRKSTYLTFAEVVMTIAL